MTKKTSVDFPIPPEPPEFSTDDADARDLPIDDNSVDVIITSPPYYNKRDYQLENQIGQEESVDEFINEFVSCLDEWDRVLRSHGSVFLNLGDKYENQNLLGVPWRAAEAAQENGWLVRDEIVWAKPNGMPTSASTRLTKRHEYIFHLTKSSDYYYDLHGYSKLFEDEGDAGDVWEIAHDRNEGGNHAPFPEELVERLLYLACPPAVCTECGNARERELRRTTELDESRQQARRAKEIYEDSDLTEKHIRAIQSVGIADAGKGRNIQNGTAENSEEVRKHAAKAKEVLGGYFREFTFAKKETAYWTECDCDAPTEPGTVLDPFTGTGTVVEVAAEIGCSAVGTDLDAPEIENLQIPIKPRARK